MVVRGTAGTLGGRGREGEGGRGGGGKWKVAEKMTSQNFEMKGKLLKLIYNVMHMTLQNLEEASRMENVLVARLLAHPTPNSVLCSVRLC